ncbi:MAG TPA: hypothetical protein DCM87_00260 [Planctomycetes bacterium]|nr:hypothetical protein [Planctomycetota bacterium]
MNSGDLRISWRSVVPCLMVALLLAPYVLAAPAAVPPDVPKTPAVEEAVTQWLRGIQDKDPRKRAQSAGRIGQLAQERGRLGDATPKAIAALAKATRDPDPCVRSPAVWALGKFLYDAKEAGKPLVRALNDKDANVRSNAACMLGQLGARNPEIPGAIAALTRALDNASGMRLDALRALQEFRAGAKSAVPRILLFVSHADPRTRHDAVRALAWIDPGAKACIEVFKKGLADDVVRRPSAEGLYYGGAARDCVPLLIEALKAELCLKNGGECADIAGALGEAGTASPEIVPALIGLLGHRSGSTRLSAAKALGKIGAEAKEAIPALEKLAKDEIPGVAKEAEEALAKIKS